jgi:flagellar FliL protein
LCLINLVLTAFLTFTLVQTNTKTNSLITHIAEIIDLDVAGGTKDTSASSGTSDLTNIEYLSVTNGEETTITVTYVGQSTHYAVLSVTVGINKSHKDYNEKIETIKTSMALIVSDISNIATTKYTYQTIANNKADFEKDCLAQLQERFQTNCIYSVLTTVTVQ